MRHLLDLAVTSALEAGGAILKIYYSREFDLEIKEDNSPLTKADKISHQIISSNLMKTNIPILSEEGKTISYQKRKEWKKFWIIDPLDGTKEFVKRNDEFTVNIALIDSQKSILGVVFVPVTGELFFSLKGTGAFKLNVDINNFEIKDLIFLSKRLPIKLFKNAFTIVASRSHMSLETSTYIKKMQSLHENLNIISRGSSLKLCMIAEGLADCYPRFAPTMEWDTAAGQAICECAGAQVIDLKTNKSMLYNKKELFNNWFIVKC